MRVIGYVRETVDPTEGDPAFLQHERIRRHAADHGLELVGVCQDARQPGHMLSMSGYRSLIGAIGAGGIDAVIISGLDALSPDQVVQEVILWDLAGRGVQVLSTNQGDLGSFSDPAPSRALIRHVLARVDDHRMAVETIDTDPPAGDVVVRLLPAADQDGA